MGVDGGGDVLDPSRHLHGEGRLTDEVGRTCSGDVHTEHDARIGVGYDLHEAHRLAERERASRVRESGATDHHAMT